MLRKVMKVLKSDEVKRLKELVTSDDDVMSGQLCLEGTRVPISLILGELADGFTVEEIAEDLDIDEEDIKDLLYTVGETLNAVV